MMARALSGVLSSATLPTAMAYISDSTSEEDRSGGMGLMGAAMGMGMVIGPGIGGWFAEFSLSTPFLVASGLSVFTRCCWAHCGSPRRWAASVSK